jgi:hypothetical protein
MINAKLGSQKTLLPRYHFCLQAMAFVKVPSQRHPAFYCEDGSIVFEVSYIPSSIDKIIIVYVLS